MIGFIDLPQGRHKYLPIYGNMQGFIKTNCEIFPRFRYYQCLNKGIIALLLIPQSGLFCYLPLATPKINN